MTFYLEILICGLAIIRNRITTLKLGWLWLNSTLTPFLRGWSLMILWFESKGTKLKWEESKDIDLLLLFLLSPPLDVFFVFWMLFFWVPWEAVWFYSQVKIKAQINYSTNTWQSLYCSSVIGVPYLLFWLTTDVGLYFKFY